MECKCSCAHWVEEATSANRQDRTCVLAERPPRGSLSQIQLLPFRRYLLTDVGVAIDGPDTEGFARKLSGPWRKSAVHSCRQQLSHFDELLAARTSASFRSRCLDQTIEPAPAR